MEINAEAWVGFLEVWAVVGPVLVGGATNWWNRRNQLNDREWDRMREAERLAWQAEQDKVAREEAHALRGRSENYEELKTAIAKYQVAVYKYIDLPINQAGHVRTEESMAESAPVRDLVYQSYSELSLLLPVDIIQQVVNVNARLVKASAELDGCETIEERSAIFTEPLQLYANLTTVLHAHLQTLR